jgi:hypothetical protein
MTDCAGKRAENQGSPVQGRINVARFKDLVNGRALDIIGKRMKIVGKPTAREVRIINTHRREKTASSSWNVAKGVFCDKGDTSYNGDIIHLVAKCDGVAFADAARIVAEDAGVDIPYLDATTAKPCANQSKPRSNGSDQQRHSTEPNARKTGPQSHVRADVDSDEETPEQKIERARKAWGEGGNVLDTFGEAYLNARKIILAREEPWLRYDDAHPLYVRVETEGGAPEYALVGRFPTLIGAATIGGEGEVQAVAKIVFRINDDGTVDPKPTLVDPRTGRPFKKNKWLRGVMENAGIFLGQHLGGDAIVITEGVEDAMCAVMAGLPAVAKMGAQSLENLELPSRAKRVILAGDNDEAGQAGVRKAAPVYHERGYTVAMAELPRGIKDLNDLLKTRGVDAVRDVLSGAAIWEPAPDEPDAPSDGHSEKATSKDDLIEFADDVQLPTKSQYLIKHLLGRGDMAAIYGPPGVGKSFIALHVAACIAMGRPFAGRRTRAMPVLYVGLEGEAGIRRRMLGLHTTMGPFGKMLARMRTPTLFSRGDFGDAGERFLTDAIACLRECSAQDVGLVVIDTVWRAMAGDDENSAQDMGAFVARLKRIQDATGVAILLVHHSGKDVDRGMRGSSSLLGALDLMLKVGDDKVIAVEKNKDGPDGAKIGFKLRPVDLGLDDEGDPINTCVVEIEDAGSAGSKPKKRRPKANTAAGKALEQLEELIIDGRYETVVVEAGIPDRAQVVKLEVWRNACHRKGLSPGSETEKRDENEKRAFRRVVRELDASNWIGITNDKVWIVREDRWQPRSAERPSTAADDDAQNEPVAA